MNTLPQISDAEFEVMNIIWKYAPINTNDIIEKLSKAKEWNPKTIQTMIFRLEKKGVIAHGSMREMRAGLRARWIMSCGLVLH